jgi:hypothetical protein
VVSVTVGVSSSSKSTSWVTLLGASGIITGGALAISTKGSLTSV